MDTYWKGVLIRNKSAIGNLRVLVMGTSLGVSFPARCYIGVLQAHLRYDLISAMDMCSTLLRAALFVWVLLNGGKLLALALAAAAVSLVRGGATIMLAQWVHGRTRLSPSLVTRSGVGKLFGYASFTFVAQISDLLRRNVYPFIILGFLSLAAVTPYAIAERLKSIMTQLSVSVLSTLAPVFSRQEGRGAEEALRWSYFFTYKISCYVGVFLGGMMAIIGADFVLCWVGPEKLNVVPILYMLVIGAALGITQIPTVNFLYGTSRHYLFAIANVTEGISNVILAVALIRPYGLVGMAFGATVAAALAKVIILPLSMCRALNISLVRYYVRHTLPNMARPALFIAIVFVASRPFLAPDYLRLLIVAVIAFLLFVPYIFFVGFDSKERALFLRAIVRRTQPLGGAGRKSARQGLEQKEARK